MRRWFNKVMCLGGLVRKLDMKNEFGPWDEINFGPSIGYYLSGCYGRLRKVSKQEGRLYMRGLACPIIWQET